MSGDMNTSMGNKLLMCLMAKAYIDTKAFRVDFVNNGDDCLLIFDASKLAAMSDLETYFSGFGFKMVREDPVYEFEQIEFCQTKPIQTVNGWLMVRNTRTCLVKDVTAVNMGHDVKQYRVWLGKIADCGVHLNKGVPVLQSFYRMCKRFGVDGKLSFYSRFDCEHSWHNKLLKGMDLRDDVVTESARYSYWLQTDICPDQQVEIEGYFDQSVWGGDKRQLINVLNLF
jgi:hypothetical protein